MKVLMVLCVILAMSCSTFGASENIHAVVVRSRRDLMENAIRLIEELIANMQKAAKEALEAVGNFTASIIQEAEAIRNKIIEDIQRFRNRVTSTVENVFERFSNTTDAVRDCVDSHREQASTAFNNTVSLTMACVDERIADVGQLIDQLKSLANDALSEASTALESIKQCTHDTTNLLDAGACLGNEAIRAEVASVAFLSQSTLLVGRINLAIATLPGSFEVCAGTRLIETGVQTGRIIMEIGTCSANVIFNYITGQK